MTQAKTIAKWTFRLLPSALLIAFGTSVIFSRLIPDNRSERFVAHWTKLFQRMATLEEISGIPTEDRPELIFTRRFTNGEWVMVRGEYSCTDGAGFDATVFRDSSGIIRYQTGHHYCGFDGLRGELNGIEANSITEFFESIRGLEVTEQKK
jgi:hypothetical protein